MIIISCKRLVERFFNCCRDPNGYGLPSWPEFSVSARRHLELGGPFNFTVRNTLRAYDYCDDWRSINQQLRATQNQTRCRDQHGDFCCAMLCKRGLCRHAVSVCPSVRVSVTFVHSISIKPKTNKDFFEIVSPSGRQAILVFPYQTAWQYSDWNPPNGGVKCRWGRQRILSQYLASSHTVNAVTASCYKSDCWRIPGYRSMPAAGAQLTVVRPVVYHSYGACLFTAQKATHQ